MFLIVLISVIYKLIVICLLTFLYELFLKTIIILGVMIVLYVVLKLLMRKFPKVAIRVFAGEHDIDFTFVSEDALKTWLFQNRGSYDFYERIKGG
jgi:hypothetical protein